MVMYERGVRDVNRSRWRLTRVRARNERDGGVVGLIICKNLALLGKRQVLAGVRAQREVCRR